jgi:hypothetical protein
MISRTATKSDHAANRKWEPNWVLLFVPPLLLFIKDFIAINAMLATEPGITARTKFYFGCSQLPGTLVFDDLNGALLFNYVLAFILGGLWWFMAARRSRKRAAEQIVGRERRERVW